MRLIAPLWIMFVASIGINAETLHIVMMPAWFQPLSENLIIQHVLVWEHDFHACNVIIHACMCFMSALCSSVNERGRDMMLNRAVLTGSMIAMIVDWNQNGFPPPMKYFMFASRVWTLPDGIESIMKPVVNSMPGMHMIVMINDLE